MPAAGDRVVFEGVKVGGGRREGELLEVSGRSVRVRWDDGTTSLLFPGPGAMRVVAPVTGRTRTQRATKTSSGGKSTVRRTAKAGSKSANGAGRTKKGGAKKR